MHIYYKKIQTLVAHCHHLPPQPYNVGDESGDDEISPPRTAEQSSREGCTRQESPIGPSYKSAIKKRFRVIFLLKRHATGLYLSALLRSIQRH